MVFGRGNKAEAEEITEPLTREQALLRQTQILQQRVGRQEQELKRLRDEAGEKEGFRRRVVETIKTKVVDEEFCVIKPSRMRGEPVGSQFPVSQPSLMLASLGYTPALAMPPERKRDISAIVGEQHTVPIRKFDKDGRPTDRILRLLPNTRNDWYKILWEPAMAWDDRFGVGTMMYDEDEQLARIPIPLGETKTFGRHILKHNLYGVACPRIENIVGSNALLKSIGVYTYDLVMLALDHNTLTYLLKESLGLERATKHLGMRRLREWERRSEDIFKMMQRIYIASTLMGQKHPTVAAIESGGEFALNKAIENQKLALGEGGGGGKTFPVRTP